MIALLMLNHSFAQLAANAGGGGIFCPDISSAIGGTPAAIGGVPPYSYSWTPGNFLSSTTIANPTCTPSDNITYELTVTDANGDKSTSSVSISMSDLFFVNAGSDTTVCFGDSATLGGENNNESGSITYSWLPTTGLSDNSVARPLAAPNQTTTYVLTAFNANCAPKTESVTITIIPTPDISAGEDVTINEGEVAILQATGGVDYEWTPYDKNSLLLRYPKTENPDVEPLDTMDFYVKGYDDTKTCFYRDTITINVIPSEKVVFYNTFTPNGDGNNDYWHIGNIEKYPECRLEVYNRNGKRIFKSTGYTNGFGAKNFSGRAFGEELPAATYFYDLDLGVEDGKYHGTVTIIR